MNFAHLEYFRTVVQCGSISKAAEKLYMDRGNLSSVIAALEKEYEVPLLIRSSKGITLTEYGKYFYTFAQQVLIEHEQLKNTFSVKKRIDEKNELLLFFPNGLNNTSFFELFDTFYKKFPQISLSINETLTTSTIVNSITNDCLFIYFFITLENKLPSYLKEEDFAFHLIEVCDAFVYCTEDNIFSHYKSLSLKSLKDTPILLYSSTIGDKPPVPGISSTSISTVSNFSLFQHMLSTGKWISIGSDRKNAIDMRNFVKIPISDDIKYFFYVAVKKEFLGNPVIDTFLRFFFDYMNLPFPAIFST